MKTIRNMILIAVVLSWLVGPQVIAAVNQLASGAEALEESASQANNTWYVDADSTAASPDGTSWANAYTTLQDALAVATSGDEIWLASGVYYPDEGNGQTDNAPESTFQLASGVAIYGGFAGTETERTERDWGANMTVLSGDIDDNDTNKDGNGIISSTDDIEGNNAYHVVMGSGVTNTAILDGFTINAGQADGTFPNSYGGGLHNESGNPTLTNLTISANFAAWRGGGIGNHSSHPTLNNVTISANSANDNGGGMLNRTSSNPTLNNVTISGNSSINTRGGGMANSLSSRPTLNNVTISGNSAPIDGGGILNEGSSTLTLNNVTITANSAQYGGGIYNSAGGLASTLTNVIIWNNRASGSTTSTSASIYNTSGNTVNISHSLIANSGGSTSWNGSLGTDGGNNIDGDPLFVINGNPSAAPSTAGDYRLQLASPAIDAGDNDAISGIDTDLAGNSRRVDISSVADTGNGTPPIVDMGAYEAQPVSNGPGPGGVSNNLQLWLKADGGVTTSGNDVTAWNDQSSNGHQYSAGTIKPTVTDEAINGNPATTWPGNQDPLTTPDMTYPDWKVFVIFKGQDNGTNSTFLGNNVNHIRYEQWNDTNKLGFTVWCVQILPNCGDYSSTLDKPDGQVALFEYSHSSSSNNVEIAYTASGTVQSTTLNTNHTNRPLGINKLGEILKGDLAEVMVYNSASLTVAQEQQIKSYLALKYGITLESNVNYLDSDGATIWDASANSTYDNDIAGIGRDDDSNLAQLKSKSINSGSIVTMDKGSAFANDKDFVVWAHDGGAISASTSALPTGVAEWLVRKWAVQETGDAGAVTISVPTADFSALSTSGELVLIVADDAAFSTNVQTHALTTNGANEEVSVTFDGTKYFTFGRLVLPDGPGGVSAPVALWLKAGAGISESDGQTISSWTDQSANGFVGNSNGGDGETAPTFRDNTTSNINFNPVVEFDGVTHGVNFGSQYIFSTNDGLALIVVAESDVIAGSFRWIVDFGSQSEAGYGLRFGPNGSGFYSSRDFGGAGIGTGQVSAEIPHLLAGRVDFGTNIEFLVNGAVAAGPTNVTLSQLTAAEIKLNPSHISSFGPLTIGRQSKAYNSADRKFDGRVAEVIIVDDDLPDAEWNRIQSYLALKYGITQFTTTGNAIDYLSSAGTTIWDVSANAAYHHDVAGIAKDDDSMLDQPRSKSINDETLVTISGTISTDLSALLWGNNDGATAFDQSAGSYFTMARVWKVAESGTIGSVNVTLPDVTAAQYLLVDSDTDFEDAIAYPLTNDGNGHLTAEVNFTDGQYFTLGRDKSPQPFDITLSNNRVNEEEPIGTVVGEFSSLGGENYTYSYSLVAGAGDTDNALFSIEGSTLKTAALLDAESQTIHTIRVQSDNGAGYIASKQFVINIINVEEPPSDITLSSNSVAENQPAGTVVGEVIVTDDNSGIYNFSVVAGEGDADNAQFDERFEIVSSGVGTHTLQTKVSLDYESKSSYRFRLQVQDEGDASFAKAMVINVENSNDAPHVISLSNNTIAENQPNNTVVGTFTVRDVDDTTHTLSLVDGTGSDNNNLFEIVNGSTLRAKLSFDYELQSRFSIRVQADDGKGGVFSKKFSIEVIDEPGDPPSPLSRCTGFDFTLIETSRATVSFSNIQITNQTDDGCELSSQINIEIPGNNVSSTFNGRVNGKNELVGKLLDFDLSVVGFKMSVDDAEINYDQGRPRIKVTRSSLSFGDEKVPVLIPPIIDSNGLTIKDGFELPDIVTKASIQLKLSAALETPNANGYTMAADGTISIPLFSNPKSACFLTAGVTIYLDARGRTMMEVKAQSFSFPLRRVTVGMTGECGKYEIGIPIGTTGFSIVGFSGTLSLEPVSQSAITLEVEVTIGSSFELPFIGPAIIATGGAKIQVPDPFLLELTAKLVVLNIFTASETKVTIANTPYPRFETRMRTSILVLTTDVALNAWTKSGNFYLTGSGSAYLLGLEAGFISKSCLPLPCGAHICHKKYGLFQFPTHVA